GQVTEYTYSRVHNAAKLYTDNKTTDAGNITDLAGSLPAQLHSASQFIPGSGFLVVNEKLMPANTWYPRFYDVLDSGYRQITTYIDQAGASKTLPGTGLPNLTRILTFGDWLVILRDSSSIPTGQTAAVRKYNGYFFKFENHQFKLKWYQKEWEGSTYIGKGITLGMDIQIAGPYMLTSYVENNLKVINVYRYDPANATNSAWNTNLVYTKTDELPSADLILTVNGLIIKRGLVPILMCFKATGVVELPFTLPGECRGFYDIRVLGDKIAIKTVCGEAPNVGKFTYIFFTFTGNANMITRLSSFASKLTESGGYLDPRDQLWANDKWIGVYKKSTNRIQFTNWAMTESYTADNLANTYTNGFENGYFVGNAFIGTYRFNLGYAFSFKCIPLVPNVATDFGNTTHKNFDYYDAKTSTNTYFNNSFMPNFTSNNVRHQFQLTPNNAIYRERTLVCPNPMFTPNVSAAQYALPSDVTIISGGKSDGTEFVDVNGDGLPDIVHARAGTNKTYLNSGGSGFKEDANYKILEGSLDDGSVRLIDVNGDRLVDVVFAKDGIRHTYINTGRGFSTTISTNYSLPYDFMTSGKDAGTILVDINGDGLVDVANGYYLNPKQVCLNTGTAFASATTTDYPFSHALDWADGTRFIDLDGNGFPDLVHANEYSYKAGYPNQKTMLNYGYFLNTTDVPSFYSKRWLNYHTVGDKANLGSMFIDMNGDGLVDHIYANQNIKESYINSGSGFGSNVSNYQIPEANLIWDGKEDGSTIIDINLDGLPDFIYSKNSTKRVFVNDGGLFNTTDKSLTYNLPCEFVTNNIQDVVFTDINGDGAVDIIKGTDGTKAVYLNNSKLVDNCYFNSLNNKPNQLFSNFYTDVVSKVVVKQSTTVKATTDFKYIDPNPSTNDADIPDVFESPGVTDYFTLDKASNYVRNIKSCVISDQGTYSITYAYGDVLSYPAKTGLEQTTATCKVSELDGAPYIQRTYKSDNTLLSSSESYWNSYTTTTWPLDFYQPRLLKSVQVNDKIKSTQEMTYDALGYVNKIKSTAPDGQIAYKFQQQAYLSYAGMSQTGDNILDPVSYEQTFVSGNAD
ncbi:MAG: VCBS repeat-containing protein, partial [Fibrobacteres bacterium]|nr:VCBS repeat-containing protein [Fibrobacterota bacterium]